MNQAPDLEDNMTESKSPQPIPAHTPGPWRLEPVADDTGRIVKLCPCDGADQSILTVVDHEGVKFAAVYIDADARLIAAAPDLLAALQSARDCIELDRSALEVTHMVPLTNEVDADGAAGIAEYDAVLAQIGVAIAKATGAQA